MAVAEHIEKVRVDRRDDAPPVLHGGVDHLRHRGAHTAALIAVRGRTDAQRVPRRIDFQQKRVYGRAVFVGTEHVAVRHARRDRFGLRLLRRDAAVVRFQQRRRIRKYRLIRERMRAQIALIGAVQRGERERHPRREQRLRHIEHMRQMVVRFAVVERIRKKLRSDKQPRAEIRAVELHHNLDRIATKQIRHTRKIVRVHRLRRCSFLVHTYRLLPSL